MNRFDRILGIVLQLRGGTTVSAFFILSRTMARQTAVLKTIFSGQIMMTFGEDNREVVLALLRWLGPDAILLSRTQKVT